MKLKNIISILFILTALFVYVSQSYQEEHVPETEAKTDTVTRTELDLRNIVKTDKQGILIEHKGYTLSYNTMHNTPDWVAWELTAEECQSAGISRKNFSFIPDEDLPYQYQVTTADYTNSGYDRGHMCPAADMKWDADAMHDCFYMTNICPQVPVLNQQYWERLENACRRWAVSEGSIYIICGPIYTSAKPKHIGREHMISVPDAFFKVVISLNGRSLSTYDSSAAKGIGFIYYNTEQRQSMESASCTIDDIEALTTYDFFPTLPTSLQSHLESQNNLSKWD